jgi:2-phosphosulfolactate phosphatase
VTSIRFSAPSEAGRIVGAAVVIDVLRAFTTAAYLLDGGASELVLAATDDEALVLKQLRPGALAVKDGAPAAGFDLVNSPCLVSTADVRDRPVVQRTTWGTVGAHAARDAQPLLCASFVCASATAAFLVKSDATDVTFVATGDHGLADEDVACAELIAALLGGSADAGPFVDRARRSEAAAGLRRGLELGHRGVHEDDIKMCLEVDRFDFAMHAVDRGTHLELTRVSR